MRYEITTKVLRSMLELRERELGLMSGSDKLDLRLEDAADLVINEMMGSANAKEWLTGAHSVATPNIKASIAYHIMQSNMYFAEKETGDSKDEILKSWDEIFHPALSHAWSMLQTFWWCP